ncbi:MAG TPA: acetyl-CoA carboxylase biotin carboxyl carrier protein [Bacteroidetes bacterium]|jgi:acetyl-CoA carboxylase biotin carboxyl carrier protein|nr:acetyl-CoA carboxylase biotin carboxyl carrier protein [Bacteroidota bacterium]
MDYKEIQSLIKLISNSNLSEFKMEDGDFKLTVRTKEYHKFVNAPVQQQAPVVVSSHIPAHTGAVDNTAQDQQQQPVEQKQNASENVQTETKQNLLEIKSPIVGTFYRSPGPDKEPYVKIGDRVEKDTVVCIVEAMKLFNEIESEVSGKIVDVLVEDGTPVEYDQVLFLVDPKG